jgi:hypothetical protein
MRSTGLKLHAVMAMAALAMGGSALAQAAPLRSAGSGNDRRPTPPRMDTALQREMAEHNAALDRHKAEKRARKKGR